jgi:Transposase domain (DUF772)
MFRYLSPEQRVRLDHPLRAIRARAGEALPNMSERFEAMYSRTGRPLIPPEKLRRAQWLQRLYSVRSERRLREEIDDSVLFRWFVGMNRDEPVWDVKNLTRDEHFTADGTLLEAWASGKSFQRQDQNHQPPEDPGNPTVNFHGERPSHETQESTTDPETRWARKGNGQEAQLSCHGKLLAENRNGLMVTTELCQAQRHGRARGRLGDAGASAGHASGYGGCRQRIGQAGFRGGLSEFACHTAGGAEHETGWGQRH